MNKLLLLAIAFAAISCQPLTSVDNPLDEPGSRPQNAAEIRQGHFADITGNPAYPLR